LAYPGFPKNSGRVSMDNMKAAVQSMLAELSTNLTKY